MARIVFGDDFVDANCVILGNVNVNSPLVWDGTMTPRLRAYARANQAAVIVPFILGGAMGPVTNAGAIAQSLAETMVGCALTQLERPGAPVIFGNFLSLDVAALGLADLRHAGAGDRLDGDRPARPPARPAAALLRQFHDVEAAGRARHERRHDVDAGGGPLRRQLHPAFGRLARRAAVDVLREIRDGRRFLRRAAHLSRRRAGRRQPAGARRLPRGRARQPFLRLRPHDGELRDGVLGFARSPTTSLTRNGRRPARKTRRSAPTGAGRRRSPNTRRRRSTRRSTRRCTISWTARRPRRPTRGIEISSQPILGDPS